MHRDVKPGNVMYDRQQRKVSIGLCMAIIPVNVLPLAAAYRLGSRRVLSSEHRLPYTRRLPILQGARVARRLPPVRLQLGSMERWLHVRLYGACASLHSFRRD